jgi:hypothetical protein
MSWLACCIATRLVIFKQALKINIVGAHYRFLILAIRRRIDWCNRVLKYWLNKKPHWDIFYHVRSNAFFFLFLSRPVC